MIWLLLGCVQEPGSRQDALHAYLVNENRVWLSRDTELLASKYRRMAADPYDFMRATAGWYLFDLGQATEDRAQTAFLEHPQSSSLLIFVDPHPENLSTTVPGRCHSVPEDAAQEMEFIDLDGATWGPWLLDLRRGALGLAWLVDPLDCDCQDDVVEAFALAYAEQVDRLAEGEAPLRAVDHPGQFLGDLLEEAVEEGLERKRLNKVVADADDGGLALLLDEALDEGIGYLALTADEQAQVDRLWAQWAQPEMRFRQAMRRYGAGVSSHPSVRYYVLDDLGDEGPDDEHLVQFREVLGAPAIPGAPFPDFADNADRLAVARDALWAEPLSDGCAGELMDGDAPFKALTRSSWIQDVEHVKVLEAWEDGDLSAADLTALARALGLLLGERHARTQVAGGEASAAEVLVDEVAGRGAELADELVAQAQADLAMSRADFESFQPLLEEHGPLLGAELLAEDIR